MSLFADTCVNAAGLGVHSAMNFVIVCARYLHNSNGIKTMHKLCHTLNGLGHDARLMFVASNDPNSQTLVYRDETWTNKAFNTPVLKEDDKDFIKSAHVVYPETIISNPLCAERIIRYFGNREKNCNGMAVMVGERDFIVAHSKAIHNKPDYVLFNAEINPAFNDIGSLPFSKRKMDVTYIGKGYIYGGVGVLPNTLYVAREWPVTQEQLALVMRQTRFFFTWDSWTSTNVEAVLCGAVPVIENYAPWKPEEIDGTELGWLPRGEMDEDGVVMNLKRFRAGRDDLMDKISKLSLTWNDRVGEFAVLVEKHFNS
jgi:hypothetical protein